MTAEIDRMTSESARLFAEMELMTSEIEQMRLLTVECRNEYTEQTAVLRQQTAERQTQLEECDAKLSLRQHELESFARSHGGRARSTQRSPG